MLERFSGWLARNTPNREDLARSRWLKPFGGRVLRSEYWRFTRRSVPRGVAVGLLVGIFLLIPGLQIVGAALLSLPLRANIPLAAGMTFLSNPATTPLILGGSYAVGDWLGFAGERSSMPSTSSSIGEWIGWLFSSAAPAILVGLLFISIVAATVGYFVSKFVWRWWTARKWKRRAHALGTGM